MRDRQTRFNQILGRFPKPVRCDLKSIPQNSGRLAAEHCAAVMDKLEISLETLMLQLLPVAKLYAAVTISGFQVGAVAKARLSEDAGEFALFLGANIEFPGQALIQTIHAEQAVVMNAWLQGAVQLDVVAVSAAPCGYCRQFLYELEANRTLDVMVPEPHDDGFTSVRLIDLLPKAFGPQDIKGAAGLMASCGRLPDLSLKNPSDDPMVQKALAAANQSYAPYTQNFAGCAIQDGNGKIYTGRYAENAAFNPSLSPLHSAIINLNMDHLSPEYVITRAVLVEKPALSSQRVATELLLRSLAPDVRLEYFTAE